MAVIYGLFSTRDNAIRYIGQTHRITARIAQHVTESKNKDTDKCNWISTEQADGFEIKHVILMENCRGEVNERRILDTYLLSGHALVNTMHFPSHKEKQREGIERARQRGIRFGRKPTSPEQISQIEKMHKAGSSIRQICRAVKVSPNTAQRIIKEL
jgi:hypothetical protein